MTLSRRDHSAVCAQFFQRVIQFEMDAIHRSEPHLLDVDRRNTASSRPNYGMQ